ncbi:MAG: chemotaxis protein CheW, partial [Erythrobacter sp.]
MTVEAAGQRFAIPQGFVEEIVHLDTTQNGVTRLGDTALVSFRGQRLPCLALADVLGLGNNVAAPAKVLVLLKLARGNLFALAVDAIHNHGDLVVKPVAPAVMQSRVFAGSTLLDDGRPILMLDVPNIAELNGLGSDQSDSYRSFEPDQAEQVSQGKGDQAMLFRSFDGQRCAVRLGLVQRIETVPASAVDRSGARRRAVVDGEILPLVALSDQAESSGRIRMLRLSDGSCELLYAVAAVEDAVVLDGDLVPVADDPLVEAVTLVDEEPVSLLDGHALFARHGAVPQRLVGLTCHIPSSDWARAILAPLIKAAGYRPVDDPAAADVAFVIDAEAQPEQAGAV